MNTYRKINTIEITRLVNNFKVYLSGQGIEDFSKSRHKNLRSLMINYFKTNQFKVDYFEMAQGIIEELGLKLENVLLQKTPTPRIFRPGDHGTSFHSDYWYGHGEKTITVWTPLTDLIEGNSFSIVPNKLLNEDFSRNLEKSYGVASQEIEEELLRMSDPVLINLGESIVFHSKVLHGSPINSTNLIRVSFDFRIADTIDTTSTKDSESYFRWINGGFMSSKNKFTGMNFIKYICGGEHKSTLAQHLLIESVVKEYSISILGQEAEVERFGYPIFIAYLDKLAFEKNIDGLIIASRAILDESSIKFAEKYNKIKVYCALENEFI